MTNKGYRGAVIVLLLLWALLTIRLNSPWVGHLDGNGTWISSVARNFELYGADELGYLQLYNPGPATPETYNFYINHPPLITWSVTLAGQLFGQEADGAPMELSARLVSAYSTMISLAAFFVIGRRIFGLRVAHWALIFYAVTPMIAYYGRMPNHEPPALMLLFLFAAVMVNWLRQPTFARWLAMLACAILAMWLAWASAFMLAGLGLLVLWVGSGRHRWHFIALGVLTLLATVAIPLFYEIQQPGSIERLLDSFTYRTSNQSSSAGTDSFTLMEFISRLFLQSLPLMTAATIILGFAGSWLVYRRAGRLQIGIIGAFIVGTVGYMLVFRNAFHVHDYYKIFFLPGLALAAGFTFVTVATTPRLKRRWMPVVVGLVTVSWIGGVVFFGLMHYAASQRDYVYEITQAIKANSDVDDEVVSNWLIRDGMGNYYAYRNITWEVPPEDVQGRSGVVYVECLDDEHTAFSNLSDDVSYTAIHDCRIFRLP